MSKLTFYNHRESAHVLHSYYSENKNMPLNARILVILFENKDLNLKQTQS